MAGPSPATGAVLAAAKYAASSSGNRTVIPLLGLGSLSGTYNIPTARSPKPVARQKRLAFHRPGVGVWSLTHPYGSGISYARWHLAIRLDSPLRPRNGLAVPREVAAGRRP